MAALLLGIAIVACLELAGATRRRLLKEQITQLRQFAPRRGGLIQSLRILPDGRRETYSEVHEPLREYTANLLERALEFDRPTFDYVGESARARRRRMRNSAEVVGLTPSPQFVPPVMNLDGPEEAIYELGSFEPVVLTCKHPDPVPVHLSDGALVAWICTRCQADGRFPWPEGH